MSRLLRLACSVLVITACGGVVLVPDGGDGGAPDAGLPDAGAAALRDAFERGQLLVESQPRPAGAGLRVRVRGDQVLTLTVQRDPGGELRRRVEARTGDGVSVWAIEEGLDERFTDFVVHPSGELTVGVERREAPGDAYELLRLSPQGHALRRQSLPRPSVPAGDLPPGTPASPFLMKGPREGSVVLGLLPWLRLEAQGEDVVAAVLSQVDQPGGPQAGLLISAVMKLQWTERGWVERWARVVDGPHALIAVAWQFDEFLWLEAATRLLLAVTAEGEVVVGRTLSTSRCASVEAFGELTAAECRRLRAFNAPHRYQPFGWTRFSANGARQGTSVWAPEGLEELVVFDLAVRGTALALAGAAVRLGPGGEPAWYYEPGSSTALMPYDGYLAEVELRTGAPRRERFVDLGRGEALFALALAPDGIVAAGAADWNRWYGGMSLSRGADPLLVFVPDDGGPVHTRGQPSEPKYRHTHLWSVALSTDGVVAAGFADGPMTHSGDLDPARLSHGSVRVRLVRPAP